MPRALSFGLAKTQEFGKSKWDDQVAMYTICSIAPVRPAVTPQPGP